MRAKIVPIGDGLLFLSADGTFDAASMDSYGRQRRLRSCAPLQFPAGRLRMSALSPRTSSPVDRHKFLLHGIGSECADEQSGGA